MHTQVQEVQRVSYRINPVRNTLRHTLIKLTKIKEKMLKGTREFLSGYQLIFLKQKLCRPEGSGMIYLK